MKHVILIVCHKVTNALIHTAEEISKNQEAIGFIHVDKKVDITEFEFLNDFDSIELIKDRESIFWGDISQIKATINCISYIRSKCEFDYLSIISGEDFFYRGIEKFNNYLEVHYGWEFLAVDSLSGMKIKDQDRFVCLYDPVFYDRRKTFGNLVRRCFYKIIMSLGFLKNPKDTPYEVMYKGSNWFTITQSCIDHILLFLKRNPSYFSYFQRSYCCDEVFFHSIVYNSIYKVKTNSYISKCNDDNLMSLRKVDWVSGPDYPKIFNYSDLLSLKEENSFLVRKIDNNLSVDDLKSIVDVRSRNESFN